MQGDFIPTMSLGIPGDAVMALLLGALMIQGIVPGPQLIKEHPDIFWGLIASFWIGNILLVILNVPLIGIWVKLLMIPYATSTRARCSSSASASMPPTTTCSRSARCSSSASSATCCCGSASSRRRSCWASCSARAFEENFRRAMLISRGDLMTFVEKPISAFFLALCVLLIGAQIFFRLRGIRRDGRQR